MLFVCRGEKIDRESLCCDMITENIVCISGGVRYMPATVVENGNPFRPKTEDELFDKIDKSIAQADAGELQDADEAIDEVVADLGL